jgi:hypothetical protein
MGTTGHPVSYYETDTREKLAQWLKRQYTWDTWQVKDLAPGTKRPSNWWLLMEEKATGKTRALLVITSNRAKREGYLYTKEIGETDGPVATDIPRRLFQQLTPLTETDGTWAKEWRQTVQTAPARG